MTDIVERLGEVAVFFETLGGRTSGTYSAVCDDASVLIASLRSELEQERAHVTKLQRALAFWMPGVSPEIEEQLNGRAGDDACLLAGYDGDVEASWGDAIRSELEQVLEAALKDARRSIVSGCDTVSALAKIDAALSKQPTPATQTVMTEFGPVHVTGDADAVAEQIADLGGRHD